jgi:tetratricopeptide (TPR) repeat protein
VSLLFDGAALRARLVPGAGDALCVTFAPRESIPSVALPGFGEDFLREAGIPAIHLTAATRHWWLTPEMPAAIAAIRAAAAPFRRVVAYGSSMGAYGALLHARALGAQAVLALSPVISPDPAKPPFERRWRRDLPGLDLAGDDLGAALPRDADLVLAFDPLHPDAAHAAMIAAAAPGRTRPLPVPFAGHPCGLLLAEAGLLADLARAVILGRGDAPAACRAGLRAARAGVPRYWRGLAERALGGGRAALAVVAARRAVDLAPDAPAGHETLGRALSRAGAHDEALAALRRAAALDPLNPLPLRALAAACTAAGRAEEAAEAIRAAAAVAARREAMRAELAARLSGQP